MDQIADTFSAMLRPAITPDSRILVDPKESSLLDGCEDCIKVISPAGTLMHMNKAGCDALGVPADGGFGMPWVPLLHPDIHAFAYEAINDACAGSTARFQGISGTGDDLIHWDNLLTPIMDEDQKVKAILCVSRDMTEQTKLKESLKASIEREKLLTQEMRHRAKNLFSLVSGLIAMTEREYGSSAEVKEFSATLKGRVMALARASETTFTASVLSAGDDYSGDLGQIISAVVSPYIGRITLAGEETNICANNITTVALVFHELATNAMKYGALNSDVGTIAVSWQQVDKMIIVDWVEESGRATAQPTRQGFGTSVIERSLKGIGGSIEMAWKDQGLHTIVRIPAGH